MSDDQELKWDEGSGDDDQERYHDGVQAEQQLEDHPQSDEDMLAAQHLEDHPLNAEEIEAEVRNDDQLHESDDPDGDVHEDGSHNVQKKKKKKKKNYATKWMAKMDDFNADEKHVLRHLSMRGLTTTGRTQPSTYQKFQRLQEKHNTLELNNTVMTPVLTLTGLPKQLLHRYLYAIRDEQTITSELKESPDHVQRYMQHESNMHPKTPYLLPAAATNLCHYRLRKIENVDLVVVGGIPLHYGLYCPSEDSFLIRQLMHHEDNEIEKKFILFKQNVDSMGLKDNARGVGRCLTLLYDNIQEAVLKFNEEFHAYTDTDFRKGRYKYQSRKERIEYLYGFGRPINPIWEATAKEL